PWHTGRTSIRSSYGIYYDHVFLGVGRTALQGRAAPTITIRNPGYQGDPGYKDDPYGFNPNPRPPMLSNSMQVSDLDTPYTEQAAVGFQRALGTTTSLAADFVWALGLHQLVTHDLNYPVGSPPSRPDPTVGKINTFQSTAHSWYR